MLYVNSLKSLFARMLIRCGRPNFYVKLFLTVAVILCGSIIIYYGFFRSNDIIVDGWKEVAGHYTTDFVSPDQYTNLTTVDSLCARVFLLLIIITSAVENFEQRAAIRETYASNAKNYPGNISFLFLVGVSEDVDLNEKVLAENMEHRDVIVENFLDSYYNLTIKSVMLLKWVDQNCRNAAFVMKMDDDVYLNVDSLMNFTKNEIVRSKNFLVGKLYTGLEPDRRTSSKWYVPEYVYPSTSYPDFLAGVGFLMSGDVAIRLYRESLKLELFFLEDMFLTGMCAQNAKIKRRNYIGFHFFEHPIEVECNTIHRLMILLSHYLSPRNMRKMHRQKKECNEY